MTALDLGDHALYADGPPYAEFARLRAEDPVHLNPTDAGGFWSLTRHADMVSVAKDWQTWSSQRRGAFIDEEGILPKEMASLVFQMMDPPHHDRHKAILQKVFTSRAIADREPDIRATINRLIDEALERGSCDFVTDIAVELPLTVTANMLGVPHSDRGKLFHWTNLMADTSLPRDDKLAMVTELGGYLVALIAERRERPTDDLLSRLVAAEVDGERLNDLELVAHFAQLMAGGNETTRNAFAGGMLALIEHPDERRKLLHDPSLIGVAVEEVLRWHTPIMHLARTATRDTEIAGTPIAENDKVVMWFASANRDGDAFDAPDRFDVTRPKSKHLAFGAGRHFCLGNQLARLELVIAFQETLRRLGELELAGPVVRKANNTFHWMVSMPVALSR